MDGAPFHRFLRNYSPMPADTPLTPIKKLFNESWYHFVQLKVEALYDVA